MAFWSFQRGSRSSFSEGSTALESAWPPEPRMHAGERQLRVHRQRRRVRVRVGPYDVTGTAHLIPGGGLDPFLLRTRQAFLPMTDVVILRRDDLSWERVAAVAIINVGNLSELHELLTLA